MPKAIRKLQKRSRTATTVGQGKRLAFVFLMLPPGRDTKDRAQPDVLGEDDGSLLPPGTVLVTTQVQINTGWPGSQTEHPKL